MLTVVCVARGARKAELSWSGGGEFPPRSHVTDREVYALSRVREKSCLRGWCSLLAPASPCGGMGRRAIFPAACLPHPASERGHCPACQVWPLGFCGVCLGLDQTPESQIWMSPNPCLLGIRQFQAASRSASTCHTWLPAASVPEVHSDTETRVSLSSSPLFRFLLLAVSLGLMTFVTFLDEGHSWK